MDGNDCYDCTMLVDGYPLDDLILDAWREFAGRVKFRRKGDKPDATLRGIAKDDAKLLSFVYFLCADWTSSNESAVMGGSNGDLAAISVPGSGKPYDAGQIAHVILALKSALDVDGTGVVRRSETTYAVKFHCTEEDTHWFWFDLFRSEDGVPTPLITNPDPAKSANKYNVVTASGREIVQRFLRVAPHMVVQETVGARTSEVIEELLTTKRDTTVREVVNAAPVDTATVLFDKNPQAIVDPILTRADEQGHGDETRSLLRKLGLHPVLAFLIYAALALLVGGGAALIAYAQNERFQKFVDELIPGLKMPEGPPRNSSSRSGTELTIVGPQPPAGAAAQFIIHTPFLAQLTPTVTRDCSSGADARVRITWNVPIGVPPPYVLLANDVVVAEAATARRGSVVFDLPVDAGRTYTLKFGAYDVRRDHLYVSSGSEYTASCFDPNTPPAYKVATTGTADGVTATFLTPVSGAPAYFEPILRLKNTADVARTILILYDIPDPDGPAIVMEFAAGEHAVFDQLFRHTFQVRPSMSENVIRVMTSSDGKAVYTIAELRYTPPRGVAALTTILPAADVTEPPRVGDSVTPSKGSTRTRFTFRARPRVLGNVRAVRYRWFFSDCLARALRRPVDEIRFADCYTPASSQPIVSHVFVARGIYEVKLETEFATGDKTTDRFCVLRIDKP